MDTKSKISALLSRIEAKKKEQSAFDILSKIDEKSLSAEEKVVFKAYDEKINALMESTIYSKDFEDYIEIVAELNSELQNLMENVRKVDNELEDAGLKSFEQKFRSEMNEKLLKVMGAIERGGNSTPSVKSLKDFIAEKSEDLAKCKNAQNGSVTIEIPMMKKDAPAFIGTTTHVAPQPNPYLPAPTIQAGVVAIVHPRNRILEFVRTQPISTPSLVVTNEVSGNGDFEWTAEGALKPYVDFEFKTETVQARKLAAFSKASREALSDISFMQSETERIISDKYERKLSTEVLNGTGTGDSIFGISTFAPAYIQTCLNGKVESPELSEVLFAAATQIRGLGFEGALVAFVNPCDWAAEMMRKNPLGELLEMNKLLEGINVIPTSEVNPGDFLVGDLSVYTLYVYENFSINYGYENDDFRRNLVSLVAESRVFGFLPDNHKGALVADSIDSVKSLIAAE